MGSSFCSVRQIVVVILFVYILSTAVQFRLLSFLSTTSRDHATTDWQEEFNNRQQQQQLLQQPMTPEEELASTTRCAILLWGLPRAFQSIVLPSLIENVLEPNAQYNCDYFVHYFALTEEASGRSGRGGKLNPHEIRQFLEPAVQRVAASYQQFHRRRKQQLQLQSSRSPLPPHVGFRVDSEESFWKQYNDLLDRIHNTRDSRGRYLYFPWKAKTYQYPHTTDNIIKMWHTIQSAWQLMTDYATEHNINYTRVAMLRSDVMYVTPIHIWERQGSSQQPLDVHNQYAVVPGFGRYPVSDRMIYGPAAAVKIWATQRFDLLEQHVLYILNNDPGWGLHSERFVNYTLFPTMRTLTGVTIVEHNTLCFFRARSDETVWIQDCTGNPDPAVTKPSVIQAMGKGTEKARAVVERALRRKCGDLIMTTKPKMITLDCATATVTTTTTTTTTSETV